MNAHTIHFTACVQSCSSLAVWLVDDPLTQQCRSCGELCQLCHPLHGCLQCPTQSKRAVMLDQPLSLVDPQSKFKLCRPCSAVTKFKNGFPCKTCENLTCLSTFPAHQQSTGKYFPSGSVNIPGCQVENPNLTCGQCLSPKATGPLIPGELPCSQSCSPTCRNCQSICGGTKNNCTFCSKCQSGSFSFGGGSFIKSGTTYQSVGTCSACQNSAQVLNQGCRLCSGEDKCSHCAFPYVGVVSGSGVTCDRLKCPSGFFPGAEWDSAHPEWGFKCGQCGSGCLECISQTQCSACKLGFYLNTATLSCEQKTQKDEKIDIIVGDNQGSENGSLTSPYRDLPRAIEYSLSRAAQFTSCSVTIHLTKQTHYILPTHQQMFLPTQPKSDDSNPYFQMTLKPLQCESSIEGVQVSQNCFQSTSDKATLVNKIGGYFKLKVLGKLTIERIVVDSIDSIAFTNGDKCSNTKERCCTLNQQGQVTSLATANCSLLTYGVNSQNWIGSSLFSFLVSTAPAGTLTLLNSNFIHFFHPLQSLIRVDHGSTVISNSKFSHFSNTQALISNLDGIPQAFTEQEGASVQLKQSQILRKRAIRARQLGKVGKGCSCGSVTIEGSRFEKLFDGMGERTKNAKSALGGVGRLLHLDSFSGHVSVSKSQFELINLRVKDCSVGVGQSDPQGVYSPSTNYLDGFIFLQSPSASIQIESNLFKSISGFQMGLIKVQKKVTSNILIRNNTLENIFGVGTPSGIQIEADSCGGVAINSNTVKNCISCGTTEATLVLLRCKSGKLTLDGNEFNANFYSTSPLLKIDSFPEIDLLNSKFISNVGGVFREAGTKIHEPLSGSLRSLASEATPSQMVVVVGIQKCKVISTSLSGFMDLAESNSTLSRQTVAFHFGLIQGASLTLTNLNFDSIQGMDKTTLQKFTPTSITETDMLLGVGNRQFRRGVIGPLLVLDYAHTNASVILEQIKIPGMKVFSQLNGFTPNPTLLLREDGQKTCEKFTIRNSLIQNIDCSECIANLISHQNFVQKSVYSYQNLTVERWGRSHMKRPQRSVFAIRSVHTSWTAPFPQLTISNLTCSYAYSTQAACLHFQVVQPRRPVSPHIVKITNSTFEYSTSEFGIYGFNSEYHKCTWQHNRETKKWWSADISVEDNYNINTTFYFNNCSFLNSSTQMGGRGMSIAFQAKFNQIINMSNILMDCMQKPKYSDPKQQVDYYATLTNQDFAWSMFYLRNSLMALKDVTIQNCHHLYFSVFYLLNAPIIASDGIIVRNVTGYQGGVVNTKSLVRTALLNNWTVSNVAAYQGAFLWFSSGVVTVKNCVFKNNYALLGGVFYSMQSGGITISDSRFINNTAFTAGAALFLVLSSSKNNLIKHSHFENNFAHKGGIIGVIYGYQQTQNCTFKDNTANEGSFGYEINLSTVTIDNSTFSLSPTFDFNKSKATGGFISIKIGSTAEVTNSTFLNGRAQVGGAINGEGEYSLKLKDSTFIGNRATTQGGTLYFNSKKSITLENVQIIDSSTSVVGSEGTALFASQDITLSLLNVSVIFNSATQPVQAIYLDNVMFTGSFLSIKSIWKGMISDSGFKFGGGLQAVGCTLFKLSHSVVEGMGYVQKGGGLAIYQLKPNIILIEPLLIENVTVKGCVAYQSGGGIYLEDIDRAQFKSVKVIQNQVTSKTGTGGGIAYYSSKIKTGYTTPKIQINNQCEIKSNFCNNAGGGIYWSHHSFTSLPNSITNNSAQVYGNNKASYPSAVILISESRYKAIKAGRYRSLIAEANQSNPENTFFNGVQSGGVLPNMYAALIDKRGYVVATNSQSQGTLSPAGGSKSTYGIALKGSTTVTAQQGVFLFTGLTLITDPGKQFKFTITSAGVDPSKPDNVGQVLSSKPLSISISLRQCNSGEAFKDNGECVECARFVQYSLVAPTEPTICRECITSKMICYGGSKIGPQRGYWRSSNTSQDFIVCLKSGVCLGTQEDNYNPIGHCAATYKGMLCSECVSGYSRSSDFTCTKCLSLIVNLLRMFGLGIVGIVFMALLIRSTIKGATNTKNLQSVYFKIMMNHIQLGALVATFNFQWSKLVKQLFGYFKFGSELSTQFLSAECLFMDIQQGQSGNDGSAFYFINLIIYAVIPVGAILLSLFFWSIVYCRKKNASELRRGRIISTSIILLFLAHPSIVNKMMDSFNCMKIDDDQRLMRKLGTVCYQTTHLTWTMIVSLPSIVIWGLGIPLMSAILLKNDRNNLKSLKVLQKFGFLYNGYKHKYYYWESIIMIRKVMVIFIAVYLQQAGVLTQALVVFLMLMIFVFLNKALNPFMVKTLNQLETISIFAIMLTVYCGFFFLSDKPEIYQSDDESLQVGDNGVRLSDQTKDVLFVIILVSNLVFFSLWLKKMVEELINTLRNKFPKIYILIFLCGNEQKLIQQKQKRIVMEENELLRQDFEKIMSSIRDMQKNKEIILNKTVLEKINVYMATKYIINYLNYVSPIEERQISKSDKFKKRTKNMNKIQPNMFDTDIAELRGEQVNTSVNINTTDMSMQRIFTSQDVKDIEDQFNPNRVVKGQPTDESGFNKFDLNFMEMGDQFERRQQFRQGGKMPTNIANLLYDRDNLEVAVEDIVGNLSPEGKKVKRQASSMTKIQITTIEQRREQEFSVGTKIEKPRVLQLRQDTGKHNPGHSTRSPVKSILKSQDRRRKYTGGNLTSAKPKVQFKPPTDDHHTPVTKFNLGDSKPNSTRQSLKMQLKRQNTPHVPNEISSSSAELSEFEHEREEKEKMNELELKVSQMIGIEEQRIVDAYQEQIVVEEESVNIDQAEDEVMEAEREVAMTGIGKDSVDMSRDLTQENIEEGEMMPVFKKVDFTPPEDIDAKETTQEILINNPDHPKKKKSKKKKRSKSKKSQNEDSQEMLQRHKE